VKKRFTLYAVLLIAGAVALFDLGLYADSVPGNTISSVLQDQPWAAGAAGYVAVHVSRKPNQKALISGWLGVFAGATVALASSAAVGGGMFGLALGASTGWLMWGNSGRT
jgi:hypothetical protein